MSVPEALAEVRQRIAAAARRAGRHPDEVRLVAVSKGAPVEAVMAAYRAGQRDFGESRAQEMEEKVPHLPDDLRWHFVGPLQTNKVRRVRPVVVMLHSMDRLSLAEAWVKGPGRPPPALLEVNIGREEQKHGVDPEEAEERAAQMLDLGIDLRGVMAIPPMVEEPEQARPYFAALAALRDRLAARWPAIRELSAGMTEDFEVAVEEGATMVRVGRAIFDVGD